MAAEWSKLCYIFKNISNIFYPLTLTMEFGLRFENFNHVNNFWTVFARDLLLRMTISSDKAFPWVPTFSTFMSICCDKTFSRVPISFTLCPWPLNLAYFLKTLTCQELFNSECYSFDISHEYFLWQDLSTVIKIFVFVTFGRL